MLNKETYKNLNVAGFVPAPLWKPFKRSDQLRMAKTILNLVPNTKSQGHVDEDGVEEKKETYQKKTVKRDDDDSF